MLIKKRELKVNESIPFVVIVSLNSIQTSLNWTITGTFGVKCNRAWVYERVIGYRLRTEAKKIIRTQSHDLCMDHCLRDSSVDCRAANYNPTTGECFFLSNDRHSLSYKPGDIEINFTPDSNFDFLENNCIQDNCMYSRTWWAAAHFYHFLINSK